MKVTLIMEENEIAGRLLRAAANATQPTSEERSFSSLLLQTRRSFRRHSQDLGVVRGRKRKLTFQRRVILLKLAHADFLPSNVELKFLKARGLGEAEVPLTISRDSTLAEIKEVITTLYPPHIKHLLDMCGFHLARLDKSKKIIPITDIVTGQDLEFRLLQSRLVVLPQNDFPSDLMVINDHQTLQATQRRSQSAPRHSTQRRSAQSSGVMSEFSDDDDFISLPASQPPVPVASTSHVLQSPQTNAYMISMPQRVYEDQNSESEEDERNQPGEQIEREVINKNYFVTFPSLPQNAEVLNIEVSRTNCVYEVMNIYMDNDVVNKQINVRFLGEMGIDGGGLTKELFSIFFEKCENVYFKGEDCLVPHIELNKLNEINQFVVIGRILQHMLILTNKLPSKLSRITLMLIANPDCTIDDQIILQELFCYVNPYLRKIIKKGIKNYKSLNDREHEVILDFFQTNRFFDRPNSDLSSQLEIIGREILIERPRRIITKIRQGVAPDQHPLFWENCNFHIFLDMQKPTSEKVVNCLVVDDTLSNEENEVLHYFIMYIHCLSKDDVANLVFLITGSLLMPDGINIKFSDAVGLRQRPIFTTCTNTITLPKTYSNYSDLKHDLNCCLHSEEAKAYTEY